MKLALIGGGSVRTIYFIESLTRFAKRLGIDTVSIMDNDAKKLEIFGGLSEFIIERAACGLDVSLTTSLDDAVSSADYIVTSIRVGQDAMRCFDERIALSHGVIGQETTGAGGFSYALRSIPAMLAICDAVKRRASPKAVLFNFTNPSGLVTQAMYDAGYKNIIGICDNATGIKIDLSSALKVGTENLFVRVYGLNHLSWADKVKIGRVNILDKLIDNDYFVSNFHPFSYFDASLIKALRQIPNGYLYYYYHRERALNNMLKSAKTRGESIKEINDSMLFELSKINVRAKPRLALSIYRRFMQEREGSYMKMELGDSEKHVGAIDLEKLGITELDSPPGSMETYEGYAGVAFNYMESMRTGRSIDLALCVPNKGSIPGLAHDDIVEITCMIGQNGAEPVKLGYVPPDNMLLISQIKRYERLVSGAVQNRSKELAVEALMVHPLVGSYSLAKDLAKDYIKLNEPYTGLWR